MGLSRLINTRNMAEFTLAEVKVWVQNNPTMTPRQLDRFREAVHSAPMTGQRLGKLLEVAELVDFANTDFSVYRILANCFLLYLLDDDDASEAAGELDWISAQKGDAFITNLNQSTLPFAVKKHILLKVEDAAVNILSTNLLNAIAAVKA